MSTPRSQLATDVSLLPGVILRGRCVVGEGSEIGPNCILTDTAVGRRATVAESTCDRATIGDGAAVGPFCVLRPGAEVPEGAVVPPYTRRRGPRGVSGPGDGAPSGAVALGAWSSSRIAGSS